MEARGYDEVVIGEGAGGLRGGLADGGGSGGGVHGGGSALESGDLGGCEGRHVVVLYPGFACVGFVCEGERGANQVVCRPMC